MAATEKMTLWSKQTVDTADRYGKTNKPQADAGGLLTSKMGIEKGDAVLVLGCGPGDDVFAIARIVGQKGKVVGLDLDPHSIDIARGRLQEQPDGIRAVTELHVGDATNLSAFYDRKFGAIHANAFVHWIFDRPAFYREVAKVAQPGAVLGICTGDGGNPPSIEHIRQQVFEEQGCDPSGFVSFPSRQEFEEQLPAAGFKRVNISYKYGTHPFVNAEAAMDWLQVSCGRRWLDNLTDPMMGHQSMIEHMKDDFTVSDGMVIFQLRRIYAIAHFE